MAQEVEGKEVSRADELIASLTAEPNDEAGENKEQIADDAGVGVIIRDGEFADATQPSPEDDTTSQDASEQPDSKPKADADGSAKETSDSDDSADKQAEADAIESDVDKLRKELEIAERRRKDTQATYNKEHERLLAVEKELEALRARNDAGNEDFFGDEEDKPDPLAQKLDDLSAQIAEMHRRERVKEFERQEAPVREKHADYEEVVYDVLQKELETNEALREEFASSDGSPETAYKLGRRVKDQRDFAADPEAFKERIKQELAAEAASQPNQQVSSTQDQGGNADEIPDTGGNGKRTNVRPEKPVDDNPLVGIMRPEWR